MKSLFYTFYSFFILAGVVFIAACSTENDFTLTSTDDNRTLHTAKLHFEGAIQTFDPPTRAPLLEWQKGARIFIQYQTENGRVDGTAVYDEQTGEWTVNYYGSITKGESAKCEVYFFYWYDYSETAVNFYIGDSQYYGDTDASYIFENGIVILKAHLKPLTGRIRFRGTPGCCFSFEGLKCYVGYDIVNNTFSSKNCTQTLRVNDDGYTSYVYAFFADGASHMLTVHDEDGVHLYQREFDKTMLAAGQSGFIDVPTMESRNGWKMSEEAPLNLCPDSKHPHKIDMGDGLKWACCNVGASSPSIGGYCFAWGETSSKYNYSYDTYKFYNMDDDGWTKYAVENHFFEFVDNKTQLDLSDDAARSKWGGTWRMPTYQELKSLASNHTWIWTTIDSTKGYKVIADNGNTLFLPAAGMYDFAEPTRRSFTGERGVYWSSSLNYTGYGGALPNEMAYTLDVSGEYYGDGMELRVSGITVRPVAE